MLAASHSQGCIFAIIAGVILLIRNDYLRKFPCLFVGCGQMLSNNEKTTLKTFTPPNFSNLIRCRFPDVSLLLWTLNNSGKPNHQNRKICFCCHCLGKYSYYPLMDNPTWMAPSNNIGQIILCLQKMNPTDHQWIYMRMGYSIP